MCRVAMQNASWDPPAVALSDALPPARPSAPRRPRSDKVPPPTLDAAESRRAASESCLRSLASFTEALSYQHDGPPRPPAERKRSKTDSSPPLFRPRRRNRRRITLEEVYRRSLSADLPDETARSRGPPRGGNGHGEDAGRGDGGATASAGPPPRHPHPHIDVGRTYATDRLLMAAGFVTTSIPLTPTRGMAGGPGFLKLGGADASVATNNGGFWVLQS